MASPARARTAPATRKRTTPAQPPASPLDAPDFEPIRIAADNEVEEERVTLFFIGDEEYTIPKVVPPSLGLEFMRVARDVGTEIASTVILQRVLGEDAYYALEQSRAIKPEQLEQIVKIVVDMSLGRQEQGGKAKGR
jgi:hypothetical protein